MTTKITKKDYFAVVQELFAGFDPDASFEVPGKGAVTAAQVAEQMGKEIDLLAKKSSAERKPTKAQIESAERKELIIAALSDEGQTISEIQSHSVVLEPLSGHSMAALLGALVREGKAVRTKVKGVTYFALPSAE